MTSRRSFLIGLGSALAAPAVIRTAGLLMPVRAPRRMLTLEEWAKIANDHLDKMVRPPIIAGPELFDLPFGIQPGAISYVGNHLSFKAIPLTDFYRDREIIAADWPSRTIKAPPSGFKITT